MLEELFWSERKKTQKIDNAKDSLIRLNETYASLRQYIELDGTLYNYAKNNESPLTRIASIDRDVYELVFGSVFDVDVFRPFLEMENMGTKKRKRQI